MMYARQRGLTLVELMVVVAVMAIIASVAYPLYTAQVQKSRRADAKVALQSIALAQERVYTVNGGYSNNLNVLYPTSTVAIAAGFDHPFTSNTAGTTSRGYYTVGLTQTSNQDFGATASIAGAQASDADCVQFTINQLGVKGATDGGGTNCW